MKRWAKVESAFQEWIRAEDFLTRDDRYLMAEILFMHLYDITFPSEEKLDESELPQRHPNWTAMLRDVLQEPRLRRITKDNEEFATSVARDTLRWFLSQHIRFHAQHDFLRPESHFRHAETHLSSVPSATLLQRTGDLMQDHPDQEATWRFYQQAFREEGITDGDQASTEQLVLREKFLADWRHALVNTKTEKEADFLSGKWEQYVGDLSEKAERLETIEDLLDPFSRFLGEAWNLSLGNWREIDWAQIEALGQQLKSDPQLRDLLDWLGRWNANVEAQELRRRSDPLPEPYWHPNPFGKSEIIGIHHSNHLDSVLPSEIALLSHEETEVMFAQKYVEHKLLTFQYRSTDLRLRENPDTQTRHKSDSEMQGPFILCIDTSGSMYGSPEQVAKGLALAVTELALREDRNCYLISFSTGTRAIELTGMEKEFHRLVQFLRMSFHGSTDLQPAIRQANRLLQEERFEKADVLVISDFLVPRVERELMQEIKRLKTEQGVRYHSMFIGRNPDASHVPLPFFSHHWIYDLNHPGVMRQWVEYMSILKAKKAW